MKINILTIFPEMFEPLRQSILGKAAENGILEISVTDIRDYTLDRHNRVDDTPYGGGAGMVMQVQPVLDAFPLCRHKADGFVCLDHADGGMVLPGEAFCLGFHRCSEMGSCRGELFTRVGYPGVCRS